jgi:enterobactin synthetase component D
LHPWTIADVFPSFVSCESVRFAQADEARFSAIELPARLERAVAKRRLEFLAGRHCARAALRRLVPELSAGSIAIGVDRAPVWPIGISGTITHAEGFAAAAVARATDAAGIGLDSERVLSASAMDAVSAQAATRQEVLALAGARLGEAVLLTVVFSAKESLFKCLYRLVGRYFDFHDAAIVDVSGGDRTFIAELRTELGGLAAGTRLGGRFAVVDGLVHTGIILPPSSRAGGSFTSLPSGKLSAGLPRASESGGTSVVTTRVHDADRSPI